MSAHRSSTVLITVAVVLVAVATVVRFVLAPNATKLPDDTDQTVHYAGKAMMLDSKALQFGDTAHALKSGIPITVDRRLQVTSTHGDTAVLKDATTIHLGKQSLPSVKTYALDRESRRGTSPPASKSVDMTGIGPALIRVLIGVNSGCLGGADGQAAAITFLASDAASFVNGAVLPVDDSAAV